MDKQITVGERIRGLRLAQNRTLQEVADHSGISKSMVSKIENDRTMPSVATLVKIAATLGTSISSILEQNRVDRAITMTLDDAVKRLVKTEKGYWIFPYASGVHDKKMQPFLFVARKNEVVPHQLTHEGEEFVFVVEGAMKMQIGEVEYILHQGDSLYFNATLKHGIMPITEEVTYLDIFV